MQLDFLKQTNTDRRSQYQKYRLASSSLILWAAGV